MSVLQNIADAVQKRLEGRKTHFSYENLLLKVKNARTPHAFADAFFRSGVNTIAEVKFKSPALGDLEKSDLGSAVRIAQDYLKNGATAISMLTEEDFFKGHLSYLSALRAAEPDALILMKDFILEEYQILEGLLAGADAILLIVSLLGIERTQALMSFAHRYGLTTLIEVHDEEELAASFKITERVAGKTLIGVNNRNLKTLEVDVRTSLRLIEQSNVRSEIPLVSESGIRTGLQIKSLKKAGYSGFLIGSAFVSSGDPGLELKKVLTEATQ